MISCKRNFMALASGAAEDEPATKRPCRTRMLMSPEEIKSLMAPPPRPPSLKPATTAEIQPNKGFSFLGFSSSHQSSDPGTNKLSSIVKPPWYDAPAGFEMLELIGRGSFGTVYKARDIATGEMVAIKRIHVDPDKILTEVPEIQFLTSGRHPNVVELKHYSRSQENPNVVYLVMELAMDDMKSFDTLVGLPCKPLESRCREIMHQLLQGLAHLHDTRIVHRDVKPANILIGTNGKIKLCDFGLAIGIVSSTATLPLRTTSYMGCIPFGTLEYCAPELLLKKTVKYSAAIDVWAAGCTMGELLCGHCLFEGENIIRQLKLISRLVGTESSRWRPGPGVKETSIYTCNPQQLRYKFPSQLLSAHGFDLLRRMLLPSPEHRITAREALAHPWFNT